MIAALLAVLLIAQSPSTPRIDSGLAGHVRQALPRPAFGLTLRAPKPGQSLWTEGTAVPAHTLTGYPLYHHEFLAQVTPEAYRASTLYPGAKGPEITPLLRALFTRSGPEVRRRQEANARREVQAALK